MRTYLIIFLAFTVVCLCASCTPAPAPTPPVSDYNPVATIKDIMDSAIDPSADHIWEAFQTVVDAAGIRERRPQNDEEWKEVRRRAMLLVESANLLLMPGRKVAKAGEKAEKPEVELSPEEIEELISKDRAKFIKLVKEFQQTAVEQLKAVEDRSIDGILATGGDLDTRCENCHRVYWYPNDPAFKEQPADAPPAGKASEKK